MGMRRLLIASVLCAATYGCGTTSTEPKAAAPTEPTAAATQPRSVRVITGAILAARADMHFAGLVRSARRWY